METLILFNRGRLLVDSYGRLPSATPHFSPEAAGETFSFTDGELQYHSCEVGADTPLPQGYRWEELRSAVKTLGYDVWLMAAKGAELLNWSRANRFCSRCGHIMRRASEISLICSGCGNEIWPQLSPCVMVLVRRGRQALLVHARTFSRPFFGLVAGFVETGESAEQCVRREVLEETGIAVDNIKYVESQPWPFPGQLMLGFTATCADDAEPCFLDGELTDGGFYDPASSALPMLPPPPSLARRLIDRWLRGECD